MKKPFDSDVIASRTFDRDDGQVVLQIYRPFADPDPRYDADPENPPWTCRFAIHFPDGELKSRKTTGLDSAQALLLAFGAAQQSLTHLCNGTPERSTAIRWLDEDDLGLTIEHFE